ncbi:MAG: hypothetical protein K1X90_13835 [Candidatus Kapabacteria bacterium]|nr:hypothetical protein [Candidatus Kapabacteria bacterium]
MWYIPLKLPFHGVAWGLEASRLVAALQVVSVAGLPVAWLAMRRMASTRRRNLRRSLSESPFR